MEVSELKAEFLFWFLEIPLDLMVADFCQMGLGN